MIAYLIYLLLTNLTIMLVLKHWPYHIIATIIDMLNPLLSHTLLDQEHQQARKLLSFQNRYRKCRNASPHLYNNSRYLRKGLLKKYLASQSDVCQDARKGLPVSDSCHQNL